LAVEATRRSKEASSPVERKSAKPRLPEHLPLEESIIEPLVVQAEPEMWRRIGEEVNEVLDYEPARFLRRRTIRPKYVHREDKDKAPVIAPLPPALQERGIAAPGLLAHVVVSKYGYHLPLYRQEKMYGLQGVELSRQTLAHWIEVAANWCKPIYHHIRQDLVGEGNWGYVQVDETPIKYLAPGNGKTRQGYLWTAGRPGGRVFYSWQTSRAADCIKELIPDKYSGVIHSDGYGAYRSFANAPHREGNIVLAACHAHLRRKFYEALEQSKSTCGTCGWILRQIAILYGIEKELRRERAGPKLRAARRSWQSRPVHERLHRALIRLKRSRRYLPQSAMGKAIDYALNLWPALRVYLEDGRVEIDTNFVENAIRPTAIGKKNWLFVGDAQAGERGAILYTIIENCRQHGIDPYAYLRETLTQLPTLTNRQVAQWTPAAYAQRQRERSQELLHRAA
jgi:transposase